MVKNLMTAEMLRFINFSNARIKNGNFEVWDTTYSAPYTAELDTVFRNREVP